MLELYKDVTYDELLEDTVNSLHTLWRLGIVEWKDENPFDRIYILEVDQHKFLLLYEDDAVKYLGNRKLESKYMNPLLNPEIVYSEATIHQRSYSFFESFFQYYDNNTLQVCLSLSIPSFETSYFEISIYDTDKRCTINERNIQNFLEWCISKIKTLFPESKKMNSVVFHVIKSEHYESLELLKNIGFYYCGLQKNELGRNNDDIETYCYQIGHIFYKPALTTL